MNLQHFSRLALPILLFCLFNKASAQSDSKNYPFSWKDATEDWYMPSGYTFKFLSDDLTAKGASTKPTANHGPVFSNACKETSAPGACTETLMNEKFKDIELPSNAFPAGYSGVEYVTFEVQTNGKVNNYQVVKQAVVCRPCIQKAVNLVASQGEWHPAVQDGIFVKSAVVVPVFFKVKSALRSN